MNKNIVALLAPLVLSLPMLAFAGKSATKDSVNINHASVQELDERLDGVGRRIAQEIVNYREEHGRFKSVDDLDKVKYVGASLIEKNKSKISFK